MHRVLLAGLAGATLLAACTDAPASEPFRSGAVVSGGETMGAASRGTAPGGVRLTIVAEVGGRRYTGSGTGECVVEPDGTVYEAPTAMYSARFAGDGALRHLNLTAWRLKDGSGTQTTMWLEIGETSHRIATLPQGERFGRAATEVRLTGGGGAIVVDGVDGAGTPIRLTATCGTFVENTEENG
ncbi:MAG TPA: hypothetical protein VJQ44_00355 [Gemmatimonadales bacterium]|nr:hypothetical protein [Gemmatimonadales bacterium]